MRENGVQTRLDIYRELTHAAWTIFVDESSPKDLEHNTLNAMEWLVADHLLVTAKSTTEA